MAIDIMAFTLSNDLSFIKNYTQNQIEQWYVEFAQSNKK